MTGEQHPDQDPRVTLQTEVTEAVTRFGFLISLPEKREAFAITLMYRLAHREDQRSFEEMLADHDPEQSRAALELEDVLKKLHGCVIGFNMIEPGKVVGYEAHGGDEAVVMRTVRDEPTKHSHTMYVKGHNVEMNTFAAWDVLLDIVPAPPSEADVARKGQWYMSMGAMHDFTVLALPGAIAGPTD